MTIDTKRMTKEQAQSLKSFKNPCTCGGYAWRMNGRPEASPHMNWCPQAQEYDEWYKAMNSTEDEYDQARIT